MENPCWSCMYFVLICCQMAQYPCHPVEGAFVWRKEDNSTQTIYLMSCDGVLDIYPRWVCAYLTKQHIQLFLFPLQDATVLIKQGRLTA